MKASSSKLSANPTPSQQYVDQLLASTNHEDSDSCTTGNLQHTAYQRLSIQQKWQIVALIWKAYNPVTNTYPDDVFKQVSQQLHISERTIRVVQEEYSMQIKANIKFPDLTPRPDSDYDDECC